ncbi:MAG: PAS domain S-box protein, partial [Rhizobium sp.]
MNSKTVGNVPGESKIDEIARLLDGVNLIVHGLDGIISHWTGGCHALYGWSREEAIGRSVHELLSTRFPRPLEEIREIVRCDGAWEGEVVHRGKDGRLLFVATRWALVTPDAGGKALIIQTNNDVSDMKRAQDDLAEREAHLRSILDTVPESMIVIDAAGTISSFSAAAEKLFGYAAEDVCGKNVRMLMPQPD